ncbi:MAG: hypothetical protein DYG98_17455 [Haliscomenobacteraceae bacterium CHB4]|nr:hypothetical protein [Haliscomenobacteraceae bacterium CHB4]
MNHENNTIKGLLKTTLIGNMKEMKREKSSDGYPIRIVRSCTGEICGASKRRKTHLLPGR